MTLLPPAAVRPARRQQHLRMPPAVADPGIDQGDHPVVVHGDARGRLLGFPTANLASDAVGMVPADGVYAGWLLRGAAPGVAPAERLPAAISIGTNPTFGGVGRRVEAYVLDRDDLELYDEEVVLELVQRVRPTLRFDGVDALVARMHEDVDHVRALLTPVA